MSDTAPPPTTAEPLLSPIELGASMNVNKQRILAWYHEGKIPAEIAEGKIYRFSESAVRAALKANAAKKPEPS